MDNKLLSTKTQVQIIGQFLTHLRAKLKSTKVKLVEVCSKQQKAYAQVDILIEQLDLENMKNKKSYKRRKHFNKITLEQVNIIKDIKVTKNKQLQIKSSRVRITIQAPLTIMLDKQLILTFHQDLKAVTMFHNMKMITIRNINNDQKVLKIQNIINKNKFKGTRV